VLNPVAAGLCRHPADWPWSSYRVTAEPGDDGQHLALDRLLPFFGRDEATARRRYREFVSDELERPAFAYRPR
jgi:putative transposase